MKTSDCNSDKEIICNLKSGNGNAMEMLYKLHWKTLYVSAYNVLKDREACEDIIQELFIKIWDNKEKLNITSSIQIYLFAAMRHEVYRKVKAAKRYEPIVDEMINKIGKYSDYNALEYTELQTRISSVVNALSPKCKVVYILSRDEQLSHKQIADKLNISTKTVRNHLTRALHNLRMGIIHLTILFLTLLLYK